MPPPRDFRDHPEYYSRCDFPMQNQDALRELLPQNAKLLIGDVSVTVPEFLRTLDSPIGFVSIDVDYFWSTVEALRVLDGPPENYLPLVPMYIDDVEFDGHSIYAGELLALEEFNRQHSARKITKFSFLRQKRIFQRPNWIDHTYTLHVFDHPSRYAALVKLVRSS